MRTEVAQMMRSPLMRTDNDRHFLRLVLAEAALYGMPGKVIALLDDVAAMLGMYEPLNRNQAAHLASPLVNWRTHADQTVFMRTHEVEKLAFKQRALIAFGGYQPGHMVGTAEILIATGNIVKGTSPVEYWEIFCWATVDVLKTLSGKTEKQILAEPNRQDWKLISDDEVLKPGGRLHSAYQDIATSLRREGIKVLKEDIDDPRKYLRPIAASFLETHQKIRNEAVLEGLTGVVERIDTALEMIGRMFPDLKDIETEAEFRLREEVKDIGNTILEIVQPPIMR